MRPAVTAPARCSAQPSRQFSDFEGSSSRKARQKRKGKAAVQEPPKLILHRGAPLPSTANRARGPQQQMPASDQRSGSSMQNPTPGAGPEPVLSACGGASQAACISRPRKVLAAAWEGAAAVLTSQNSIIHWGSKIGSWRKFAVKLLEIDIAGDYVIALTTDFNVLVWHMQEPLWPGLDEYGLVSGKPRHRSDVVHIAAGCTHALALTAGGQILAWGNNETGMCDVPSLPDVRFVGIGAGYDHSTAVTSDGAVFLWGGTWAPAPRILQLDLFLGEQVGQLVGGNSFCAFISSWGRLLVMAESTDSQLLQDLRGWEAEVFLHAAAGEDHLTAVTSSGRAVVFGHADLLHRVPELQQGEVFVQVAAGQHWSIGLTSFCRVVRFESVEDGYDSWADPSARLEPSEHFGEGSFPEQWGTTWPAEVTDTCPAQHPLLRFTIPNIGSCDRCGRPVPYGTEVLSCRSCNFDVCPSCW